MTTPGPLNTTEITVRSIHTNTEQTVIQITEDRLRLALIEHLGRIEAKRRWQVPLGVLLALVPILLTSDFKDAWSVDKATWRAFFMLATVASFLWLAATLRTAFGKATVDTLIETVKNVARRD